MTEVEQLRRRVAAKAIEARLAAKLDPDYAALMGERNGERVAVSEDGTVDIASLSAVVTELLRTTAPKWLLSATGPTSFAQLRVALKAEREREKAKAAGPTAIERLRAKL